MIFLPLACSTAILPYYHELEKLNLQYNNLRIVAMDFGIKSALFDECLIKDTWFMGSGALFIFVCIWFYTESLFLTIMTIILVIFSLAIAYFTYIFVLEIHFFPFMNLLAIVVAIGKFKIIVAMFYLKSQSTNTLERWRISVCCYNI